ncbi:MAG TPA: O-antigen ligase family protein [Pyrinomonadaceae bacterium]|nr:O-antigen ligase family protein [Pyrinomonadaceae bacterium]
MSNSRSGKLLFLLYCSVIVVTTMLYGAVHPVVLALFYSVVALMIAIWAIGCLVSGRLEISSSLLQVPVAAAAIYGLIQVIPFGGVSGIAGVEGIPRTISIEPFATQVAALHFLALFFFFGVTLVVIDSPQRIKRLVAFLTIFGFLYAFFAILQGVLSPGKIYSLVGVGFGTPYGTFVNRHDFAAFMEMTICLPLGLLVVGAVPKDKRLLYITAASLMGIALLLSGSRGGFVSMLCGILILLLLVLKRRDRRDSIIKIALAVGLVAAIVIGAILVGGESSLTRFADTATSNDFSSDRMHIWRVTLSVISHHIPFGSGLGTFGSAYTAFDTYGGMERVEQAHNDYLQVLADAGVVGLAIGLSFLFFLYDKARQSIKIEDRFLRGVALGAVAGCSAILVHSIFDFVLHITAIAVLFLTLIALIIASVPKYRTDAVERKPITA